jgi:hypothetical protein
MLVFVTPCSVAPFAVPGPQGEARLPNEVVAADAAAPPPATAVTMAVDPTRASASKALTTRDR